MKRLLLLFCALGAPLSAAEPLKLLFAGSSSLYWNDLPREVAKVVDEKIRDQIGRSVIAEAVGRSGSDIRVYLEPGFNRYEYGVKPGQTFLVKTRRLQTRCHQATMAKWMFKHMAMNQTATLDEEAATCLETVAWETWQDLSSELQGKK